MRNCSTQTCAAWLNRCFADSAFLFRLCLHIRSSARSPQASNSRQSIGGPADFHTAVGQFVDATQEIEAVLRATSVSWARTATSSWRDVILATANRASGDRQPGKLTFGDWKAIFCQLPEALIEKSRRRWLEPYLVSYRVALKSAKAVKKLDSLVGARNGVAHRVEDLKKLSPPELDEALRMPVQDVCGLLRALQHRLVIPSIVQPLEERCDPYGRRTIRFLAEDGRTVEMFSPYERDLTIPYVWLPLGTNPRVTRPQLLELDDVFSGVGG